MSTLENDNEENSLFSDRSSAQQAHKKQFEPELKQSISEMGQTEGSDAASNKNCSFSNLVHIRKKRASLRYPRYSHTEVLAGDLSSKDTKHVSSERGRSNFLGKIQSKLLKSNSIFKNQNSNLIRSIKDKYKTKNLKRLKNKINKDDYSYTSIRRISKQEKKKHPIKKKFQSQNLQSTHVKMESAQRPKQNETPELPNFANQSNITPKYVSTGGPYSNPHLDIVRQPIKKQIKFSVQTKPFHRKKMGSFGTGEKKKSFAMKNFERSVLTPGSNFGKKLFASKNNFKLLKKKFISREKSQPEKYDLEFKFNQDNNGLFYFLGTNKHQEEYMNPFKRKEISVFISSLERGDYSNFVDQSDSECLSKNEQNSFMGVDLGHSR